MRARGFTLVEMLVSMAIFAVITVTVIAGFRAGRAGDELRVGNQVVAGALRRMQTFAIGGRVEQWCVGGTSALKRCPNGTAAECPSGACMTDIPKGYGVRFTAISPGNARMSMFTDIDGDRALDPGEEISSDPLSSTVNVVVTALSPVAAGTLDVVFAPPKPTVYLNGVNSGAVAAITLGHLQNAMTKIINVNTVTGQVSSQ